MTTSQQLVEQYGWDGMIERIFEKAKGIVRHPKEFKEWLKTKEYLGYICDPILYAKLFNVYKLLKKQRDRVIVIAGPEGTGKSTLGCIAASIVDPSFTIDRVCTSPVEFIRSLKAAQPGQALQIDEGALALFSRESMSDTNRNMVKTLMVIRRKSLFLVICIPNYKLIDSYIRSERISMLFQIVRRGDYKAVFGDGLRYLNDRLKYVHSVGEVKLSEEYFWHGRFTNCLGNVSESDYLFKKDKHIDSFLNQMEENYKDQDKEGQATNLRVSTVCKMLGCHRDTLVLRIKSGLVKAITIGDKYRIPKSEVERLVKEGI